MLKTILGIVFILPLHSFAQSDFEQKVQIKEIKAWVNATGKDHTCADEYLSRRKQLSWRMALAPASLAGGIAGGALAGWADLAYTVGGAAVGAMAGVGVSATALTISTVNFFNNQRLLKAIYESHNEAGKASQILHLQYVQKYPDDSLSIQDFSAKVAELDLTGKLCDGSIVAPSRHKKGRKLKQNLATKKEIFKQIHEELTKG